MWNEIWLYLFPSRICAVVKNVQLKKSFKLFLLSDICIQDSFYLRPLSLEIEFIYGCKMHVSKTH